VWLVRGPNSFSFAGRQVGIGVNFFARLLQFREISSKQSTTFGFWLRVRSQPTVRMGTHKKTRKFQIKKIISQRDARLKKNQDTGKTAVANKKKDDDVIREA
jgi:hypothetical protein